jgi:hypothetical protein
MATPERRSRRDAGFTALFLGFFAGAWFGWAQAGGLLAPHRQRARNSRTRFVSRAVASGSYEGRELSAK